MECTLLSNETNKEEKKYSDNNYIQSLKDVISKLYIIEKQQCVPAKFCWSPLKEEHIKPPEVENKSVPQAEIL